jgi:hypothetical protein
MRRLRLIKVTVRVFPSSEDEYWNSVLRQSAVVSFHKIALHCYLEHSLVSSLPMLWRNWSDSVKPAYTVDGGPASHCTVTSRWCPCLCPCSCPCPSLLPCSAWAWMDMQHGHKNAAWTWTCSMGTDMHHGHGIAAWTSTCRMDMGTAMPAKCPGVHKIV